MNELLATACTPEEDPTWTLAPEFLSAPDDEVSDVVVRKPLA